jgi:outer membrane protein assembly factor BamA
MGYPWLVRGYDSRNLATDAGQGGLDFNNLIGSKILVSNAELRLPLSGPERLALIRSRFLYTDLNLFFDAGLAWSAAQRPELKWQPGVATGNIPVFSTGASMRLNLFGYMVIEPFYAIPFQNGGWRNGVFGVNLTPGW